MFWKVIILSVILISIAIIGIGVKMFLKKGGEFKKTCAAVDPLTGEKVGCVCGKGDGGKKCENKDP